MKTSSAKAKGRNLQNKVRDLLIETYKDSIEPGDVTSTSMGVSGQDIKLSPHAKKVIASLSIECKNQETLSIWKSLKQCEANTKENEIPILVFKRNRSKTYVTMDIDWFIKFLTAYSNENKLNG